MSLWPHVAPYVWVTRWFKSRLMVWTPELCW